MDGYNHNTTPSSSDGGHHHHQNMSNAYSAMNGWNVIASQPEAVGNFAYTEHGETNSYVHPPNNNVVTSHSQQVPYYVQQESQAQGHHQLMTSPSSMSNYGSNYANGVYQGLLDSQQQQQQQQSSTMWYQASSQGIHYQAPVPPPPPPPPPPPAGPPSVPLLLEHSPQPQIASLLTTSAMPPSHCRYDQIFMGNVTIPGELSFPPPHHLQHPPLQQQQQQLPNASSQQIASGGTSCTGTFQPPPPPPQSQPFFTTGGVSLVPQQARKCVNKKKNRRKPKKNPKKAKRRREQELLNQQHEQQQEQHQDNQQLLNDTPTPHNHGTPATHHDFSESPRRKMSIFSFNEEDAGVNILTATNVMNVGEVEHDIPLRDSDSTFVSCHVDDEINLPEAPPDCEPTAPSSDDCASQSGSAQATSTDGQEEEIDTPRTMSRKTLQLVRAKLERARQKKMDMEERMRKEQAGREVVEVDHIDNNYVGVSVPNNNNTNIRTQDAIAALERARSNLRGALKKRLRALGTPGNAAGASSLSASTSGRLWLSPVSGLSASMVIPDIAKTGPAELVYFPHTTLENDLGRERLIAMLGEKVMKELHSDSMPHATEYSTAEDSDDIPPSTSLANRKRKLQQELMALKEKLEKTQQTAGNPELLRSLDEENEDWDGLRKGLSDSVVGFSSTSTLKCGNSKTLKQNTNQVLSTKEELERRKVEAQNVIDISYWKHFVSKQELLLSQITEQIEEKKKASEECRVEEIEIDSQLQSAEETILLLETHNQVIEDGIAQSMTQLLESRQALHEAFRASRNADNRDSKLRV